MLLEAADRVNAMSPAPRFVCVCGDLVNAWPRLQKQTGGDANPKAQAQVDDLKDAFQAFREDIPLVCLCGNHDVGNRPTPATVAQYRTNWGDDYYSFTVGGCLCVVINSSLYHSPVDAQEDASAQDAWLLETLSTAGSQATPPVHTLIFGHIPPFISAPDEPQGYFNWDLKTRRRVLDLMHASGANVHAWFSGHYHRNAGGWDEGCEVVTTAAIGTNLSTNSKGDPLGLSGCGEASCDRTNSGLRLVHVGHSTISHRYFTLSEDMPTEISARALGSSASL